MEKLEIYHTLLT